jgi:type IV secretion system pilin
MTGGILGILTMPLLAVSSVQAVDVVGGPCSSGAASSSVCQDDTTNGGNPIFGPSGILTVVVKILSLIVGVFAVIFIIIESIRIVLSSGDAQSVAKARNGIIYALVGVGIAAVAQAIVAFVLNKVQ